MTPLSRHASLWIKPVFEKPRSLSLKQSPVKHGAASLQANSKRYVRNSKVKRSNLLLYFNKLIDRIAQINLLWMLLLPLSVLALGILLDQMPAPRKITLSPRFWERTGQQAFATGNPRLAISLLNQATDSAQGLTPEGWLLLGDACQAIGDLENALQAWVNAGNSTPALERQLQAHLGMQDYPAAVVDLQALLSLHPDDAGKRFQLGLLLAVTQPDQAVQFLASAAEGSSDNTQTLLTLQQRILAAQPAGQPAYTLLEAGRALADLGEWELAAEAFRRAAQLRPDYPEAWAFLGEALQHLNIPEGKDFSSDGLAELEYARTLDPSSASAGLFTALYWRRQGQFRRAVNTLEALAALDSLNPVIQIELGNTLVEKGDPKAALPYFVRATELAPDETHTWITLVDFSIQNQYQLRQVALPASRQLLRLTPNDPAALDRMGQSLLLLDDFVNAERFIRRAMQAAPRYAPAHLHLAQVFLQRGDIAAARQELSLFIELASDSPEAELAKRLLEGTNP